MCVCETGYLVHVREKFCHQTLFAFIVGVSSHRIISSDDVIGRLRPLSLASIQILGQKYVEDTSPPLWILIYRRTFEKNIFYFRR